MDSLARYDSPDHLQHLIPRGRNRGVTFVAAAD